MGTAKNVADHEVVGETMKKLGCFGILLVLVGFIAYGLYVSWGITGILVLVIGASAISGVLAVRLRRTEGHEEAERDKEETTDPISSTGQPVTQDPDSLLAHFRNMHEKRSQVKRDDSSLQLDENDEAFQRAVEEVKKMEYADDSSRMKWVTTFENYTTQFAQRAQLKTKDPLMQRLNPLFIMNGFLYLRVFVNLLEIAHKMERVDSSHIKNLDDVLAGVSKEEYERMNRVIALHYVDLFVSDHAVSVYFDDTFTKSSLITSVIEGLSFGKREKLLLQSITTDTEYVDVLLGQLQMERGNKQLIDLAKTAFENTHQRLSEKLIAELNNQARH